jgi:NAD(P)-dependent dehydrogenase (short-subunit alcohol dehydrogenase family)
VCRKGNKRQEGETRDTMLEMFSLKGRVALVTGSSRGLGWAMAQALMRRQSATAIGSEAAVFGHRHGVGWPVPRHRRSRVTWQPYRELAEFADLAVDRDAAAVPLCDDRGGDPGTKSGLAKSGDLLAQPR